MFDTDNEGGSSPSQPEGAPGASEVADSAASTAATAAAHEAASKSQATATPSPAPGAATTQQGGSSAPDPVKEKIGVSLFGKTIPGMVLTGLAVLFVLLLVAVAMFADRYDIQMPRFVVQPGKVEQQPQAPTTEQPLVTIVRPIASTDTEPQQPVQTAPQPPVEKPVVLGPPAPAPVVTPKPTPAPEPKMVEMQIPLLDRSNLDFATEGWWDAFWIRRGDLSGYAKVAITPNSDSNKAPESKILYIRIVRKIDDGKALEIFDRGADGKFYRVPPEMPKL